MGGSFEWREPKSSKPERYSQTVQFGTRAAGGAGLLCYSQAGGPGVLLLHEFFGLQNSFKEYAARLGEAGFTVLAPDLYDGAVATTVEGASELRDRLDVDKTIRRLGAAADFLSDNWHPRLGVIGFSLGAAYADAVARTRPVEATVFYYGFGRHHATGFSSPLLVHLAGDDEWLPVEEARAAVAALEGGGVDVEAHAYPGTGHWFANPAVLGAFDPAAADLAFTRTVDFLRYHLA